MSIPYINLNGIQIDFSRISEVNIGDTRVWVINPPTAIPQRVPVTTEIGTPIVDIPGCVKINRENSSRKEGNKNKVLVDDDPKGNIVLCDGGMPYYEPADYKSDGLTWETVKVEQEEPPPVNTGDPPPPPDSNTETPDTPIPPKEVECPPPNARRIGDRSQTGKEQIKEYKLTPDGKICETIWEPVPAVQQFLPSIETVSTTATIATVATVSALFAKPIADLLLKVVKPVVKKGITAVKKKFGRPEKRMSRSEWVTQEYRKSRGLPPIGQKVKKKD